MTYLNEFTTAPVEVHSDGSLAMHIPQDKFNLVQKASLLLIQYDEETDSMIYYGEDDFTHYGDGKLTTDFDGKWPAINDTPLSLEVISSNDAFIRYESPILLNNQEKTLVLAYDRTTKETYITGIREAAAPDILSRQITILENGNTIKYNPEETTVEEKPLNEGMYIQGILLQDFRGNMYLSPLVQFEMEKGRVINASVSGEYRTF